MPRGSGGRRGALRLLFGEGAAGALRLLGGLEPLRLLSGEGLGVGGGYAEGAPSRESAALVI